MFFVGRRRIWENRDPPFQSMRIVAVRSLPFSLHCAGHYNRLVFTQTQQTCRVQAEGEEGGVGAEG